MRSGLTPPPSCPGEGEEGVPYQAMEEVAEVPYRVTEEAEEVPYRVVEEVEEVPYLAEEGVVEEVGELQAAVVVVEEEAVGEEAGGSCSGVDLEVEEEVGVEEEGEGERHIAVSEETFGSGQASVGFGLPGCPCRRRRHGHRSARPCPPSPRGRRAGAAGPRSASPWTTSASA